MFIEYHGWVVLATSQEGWSNDDFEAGFKQVERLIQYLRPDEGHEPMMPVSEVLPRVAYLKGFDVESLDSLFLVIEKVGIIFDNSYGEITVLATDTPSDSWSFSNINRYLISDGRISS